MAFPQNLNFLVRTRKNQSKSQNPVFWLNNILYNVGLLTNNWAKQINLVCKLVYASLFFSNFPHAPHEIPLFFFTWPDMGPSCKVPFLRPALWTNCKSHLAPWSVWHCSDKPTSPFGSLRHMVQNSGTAPLRSTQIQGLSQWSKIKNSIWKLLTKTKIFLMVSNMYDSVFRSLHSNMQKR